MTMDQSIGKGERTIKSCSYVWTFLACSVSSVFATTTKPICVEIASGYREDTLRLSLEETTASSLIYEERYDSISYGVTAVQLEKLYRDMYLRASSSFSYIGKGALHQSPIFTDQGSIDLDFTFTTSSLAMDVDIGGGYLVSLTPNKQYEVSFGPLLRFLYFWQILARKPVEDLSLEGSYHSFLPKDLQINRWGFVIGPVFSLEPTPYFAFKAIYGYAFLSTKTTVQSAFTSETGRKIVNESRLNTSSSHAQLGQVEVNIAASSAVQLGAKADVAYYFTGLQQGQNRQTVQENTIQSSVLDISYRMRQTSYRILAKIDWMW